MVRCSRYGALQMEKSWHLKLYGLTAYAFNYSPDGKTIVVASFNRGGDMKVLGHRRLDTGQSSSCRLGSA